MNRSVCQASVKRVSRQEIDKQLQVQRSDKSRTNLFKVIRQSKQDNIAHQGQKNSSSTKKDNEKNELDLSNCIQESFPNNSITNSATCFDLSKTHVSHSRNHRIYPIDFNGLFTNGFTLDVFEK